MAQFMERAHICAALRARIRAGRAIVGFGAGCGMTAKSAERGGADFISVYTTAARRIEGVPSVLAWLPYGDVNAEMRALSARVLPLICHTPCIAGLGAHDPRLDLARLIDEFVAMGYSGVSNEPFCSTYGAEFCHLLNAAGIGFARETELIHCAREKNIFSLAWAADAAEAAALAAAGADAVGLLAGLPRREGEEAEAHLERIFDHVAAAAAAARAAAPDVITLVHGGPVNTVAVTARALLSTGVDGCATGSGGERLPAEQAVSEVTAAYAALPVRGRP